MKVENTVSGGGPVAATPQVHDVLMALHDVGYRVINMDVNFQDCTCAEFAMVLVNK